MGETLVSVGAKWEQVLPMDAAHNDTCKIAVDSTVYSYIHIMLSNALIKRAVMTINNETRKQAICEFLPLVLTP